MDEISRLESAIFIAVLRPECCEARNIDTRYLALNWPFLLPLWGQKYGRKISGLESPIFIVVLGPERLTQTSRWYWLSDRYLSLDCLFQLSSGIFTPNILNYGTRWMKNIFHMKHVCRKFVVTSTSICLSVTQKSTDSDLCFDARSIELSSMHSSVSMCGSRKSIMAMSPSRWRGSEVSWIASVGPLDSIVVILSSIWSSWLEQDVPTWSREERMEIQDSQAGVVARGSTWIVYVRVRKVCHSAAWRC